MYRSITIFLIIPLLLLAACNQQESLPTLVPTEPPPEPTATPPEVEATEASEPPTAVNTPVPRTRPTLPPTFTPTPSETPTLTPTEVIPTATFFNPPPTLPEGCSGFNVIFEQTDVEFPLGGSPTVSWTTVSGAPTYWVILESSSGRVLKDDIFIAETSYTFAADLFERGQLYGWKVLPLDAEGVQMCFQRGGELIPLVAGPGG